MPKLQPNDDFCGSYFICESDSSDTPVYAFCPGNDFFDVESSICLDKSLVECDGRSNSVLIIVFKRRFLFVCFKTKATQKSRIKHRFVFFLPLF